MRGRQCGIRLVVQVLEKCSELLGLLGVPTYNVTLDAEGEQLSQDQRIEAANTVGAGDSFNGRLL